MYIVQKFKNAKIKFKNWCRYHKARRELKIKDFCIISNNCWGGFIYKHYGLPFNSPCIAAGMTDDDYIKFLENLDYYLQQPIKFVSIEESKHPKFYKDFYSHFPPFPIGWLDDVEVRFSHFHSQEEVLAKWPKRCRRVNKNHLLVKSSIRTSDDPSIVERFLRLPYKNKIIFIPPELASRCPKDPCIVVVPELTELNAKGGDETAMTLKYIDLPRLLNSL